MRNTSLRRWFFIVGLVTAVAAASAERVVRLAPNAVWNYNLTCLDFTSWEQPWFDDTAWSFGRGGFTGAETTPAILAVCNTRTLPNPSAAGRNGAAMYFRAYFDLPVTDSVSLILSNAVDDAAV